MLDKIPDACTAVGIPAKVVRRDGQKVDDMDQVHIPDPVAQEIRKLKTKLDELEVEIAKINQTKNTQK